MGGDIHPIANRLKQDLSGTQDAEVANIMIAAYCQYLQTADLGGQDKPELLTRFEQIAYDAVFSPPTQEKHEGGWLFD